MKVCATCGTKSGNLPMHTRMHHRERIDALRLAVGSAVAFTNFAGMTRTVQVTAIDRKRGRVQFESPFVAGALLWTTPDELAPTIG